MRDENDRHTILAKPVDELEQHLTFLLREHSGGFIEDKYTSIFRLSLRDLYHLLCRNGKLIDSGVGVYITAQNV